MCEEGCQIVFIFLWEKPNSLFTFTFSALLPSLCCAALKKELLGFPLRLYSMTGLSCVNCRYEALNPSYFINRFCFQFVNYCIANLRYATVCTGPVVGQWQLGPCKIV